MSEHAAAAMKGSRSAFEAMVDEVIDGLPEWVMNQIDNLAVVVEDKARPDQDASGYGLLGLYEGVDKLRRGNDYFGATPDTITIFRLPHLVQAETPEDLAAEVRTTVLHELAHHLGIDDDRLHEIGY